jgi:hypothetical protein
MREAAAAQFEAAIAERDRASDEYERALGTPAERAKLVRLRAANLKVSMRDRAMRIARRRVST